MANNEVILRFDKVSFNFGHNRPILDEVDFSLRDEWKATLMGQNGSGKSTIFRLITGELQPESGKISAKKGVSIATARQAIPRDEMDITVRDFFEKRFSEKIYNIDPLIDEALEIVNLNAPHDRLIKSFSGGQQARLLLASALIQKPDLLLLDEPTNNLDKDGISHLTKFLVDYKKTCVVISHDTEFLNAFTQGVLYLDAHTRKIEQYVGNYSDVVAEISLRIEKENRKNALLAKEIQENKDKSNFFAHKGGQMRLVAKKMREKAQKMEEEMVDIRKEDKTIRKFFIPSQPEISGEILNISSYTVFKNHKPVAKKTDISLGKNRHLLLKGPNGIGKSTLLEAIANGSKGSSIADGIRVGYYRQDFSTLNFDDTVRTALLETAGEITEEELRSLAAGFLINDSMMQTKIGMLSEGQKGLVSLAQTVLLRPGLLILDEPTNHMNFRHLPIIAAALNEYDGAMVLVSHVPDFVSQIRIDEILDLEKDSGK
jgi:ATPase subunit of ABC transporter with duplicated ATPase domains